MLLFPKKPKYLRSYSNKKTTGNCVQLNNSFRFSNLGLVASEAGFISNYQMEAIRLFLRRYVKKHGQLFVRFFPNQPITKKPNEVRLGRGKGGLKYWTFFVKDQKVLFEISGYNTKIIMFALKAVKYKLSVKSYIYNKTYRWIL